MEDAIRRSGRSPGAARPAPIPATRILAAFFLLLAACGRKPDFTPIDAAYLTAPRAPAPAPAAGRAHAARAVEIDAHDGAVTDLAFADASRFATVSYDDRRIVLWSTDGTLLAEALHDHRPLAVAALPDASGLLTVDAYGFLVLWPTAADALGPGQVLTPMAGGSAVDAIESRLGRHPRLAVSPNGLLAATSSFDGIVTVWDLKGRRELLRHSPGRKLRAVAFAPDARRIAVGGVDNAWTL